jgi:hypothetical protein
VELKGHQSDVRTISYALATSGQECATGTQGGTIRLWDPLAQQVRHTFYLPRGAVNILQWSPDGWWLAFGCDDGTVGLYHRELSEPLLYREQDTSVRALCWDYDKRRVLTGSSGGEITAWAFVEGALRLERCVCAHQGVVNSLSLSHDGRVLASKSTDSTVRFWRADTLEHLDAFDEPSSGFTYASVAFHPSRPILVTTGAHDRALRFWKVDLEALVAASGVQPRRQIGQKRVHVSYSSVDHEFASGLIAALREAGYDASDGDPARVADMAFLTALQAQIRQSQALVVLISPDTTQARAIRTEVETAQQHGIPVIPVLYRASFDLLQPLELTEIYTIDFGVGEQRSNVQQLIRALRYWLDDDLTDIRLPTDQHDVYISYAHRDYEAVVRLRDMLVANGVTVWWDRDLVPGMPWLQTIEQAEDYARALVVVGSPDAADSRWVRRDIDQALRLKLSIFPVWLRGDAVNAIPVPWRHPAYIDLRENFEAGALRLERWIRAILGGAQMVLIGEVRFPQGHRKFFDGTSGDREISEHVTFDPPFTRPPKVIVGLQKIDVGDTISRIAVSAQNIQSDGFDVCFKTWLDSKLYDAIASWIAVGD